MRILPSAILSLFIVFTAQADDCAKYLKVLEGIETHFQNVDKRILNQESTTVAGIKLGKRINYGFAGSVYEVPNSNLIAKVSNIESYTNEYTASYEQMNAAKIEIEWRVSRLLQKTFPNEKIPSVPIVKYLASTRQKALLKPRVDGRSLLEILKDGEETLTPEMRKSLQEIYDFTKFVKEKINLNSKEFTKFGVNGALHIDANPSNLVWTDQGFVFYEITPLLQLQYDTFPYHLIQK